MRDIIDTVSTLQESTGMANRKLGDTFKGADDESLTFSDIKFYPDDGKYTPEELTTALGQLDTEVFWQNSRTPRTGGYAIIEFSGTEGNVYIGRFLEQIKPNINDNFIPNTFIIDGVQYKFKGKSAEKIQAGLSPQDLLTVKTNLTAGDIVSQLAEKLGTDNVLYALTYKLANGDPLPMSFPAPPDTSFTAFRDYFCEILQPIAIQQGQYTGNATEAAETFLDGTFEGTLIDFDESKNAGLSDSIISTSDGRSIKISTKGGRGASASSKNLLDSLNELSQTESGKKLLEKHEDIVEILKEIQARGQYNSPLYLGVKFDIINDDEAQQIKELRNKKPIDLIDIKNTGLNDNLINLALSRSTDNPGKTNLFYHLVAAVAHEAAKAVNDNTNFSEAASEILNNSALVQVYTKASQQKDTWTLDRFNTVFPGESIKGVFFSAGKTYYSTGIKGNFTFRINKDKKDKPVELDDTESQIEKIPTEKDFLKQAEKISLGRTITTEPKTGNVGRKLRK
jgi:hypothetical protein